ncbi:MAG: IPT/TIG domain-containing protein, partial [Ktedonobacteraceae bacterium]|nr:IPT/TIG domain-containing protein [Ktedonobacteraceae bacterium]
MSLPSTSTEGTPKPAPRAASVGAALCLRRGTLIAQPLFCTTSTTGARKTPAKFSASLKSPSEVAPSPQTPTVTGISPNTGTTPGGGTVTITGHDLNYGSVSFGTTAATG